VHIGLLGLVEQPPLPSLEEKMKVVLLVFLALKTAVPTAEQVLRAEGGVLLVMEDIDMFPVLIQIMDPAEVQREESLEPRRVRMPTVRVHQGKGRKELKVERRRRTRKVQRVRP
jgi:hypothetical protein